MLNPKGVALAAAISSGGLLPTMAMGEDTKTAKWGQVEGWNIRVDRSVGNGCFASQRYEDGTSIRIGFDLQKQSIYITLGNDEWRSLEVGKVYALRFVFDNQNTFDGELTAIQLGGTGKVMLDHSNLNWDFTKAFMERSSMRIVFKGTTIANLSLRNTYAAVAEVANCQREIGGLGSGVGQRRDPFSNSNGRDPFAQ